MERFLSTVKETAGKPTLTDEDRTSVRRELERVLEVMSKSAGGMPTDDVQALRSKVFGWGTFFCTETEPSAELPGAVLFRGNLRGGKSVAEAFESVRAGTASLFGYKYVVFVDEEPVALLSEPASPPEGAGGQPRIAFLICPAPLAQPAPTTGTQLALSVVLSLLTFAACCELGLEAQLAQLPRETLEFFASPNALQSLPEGALIPGLEAFSPAQLISGAIPITLGVLSVAAAHEAGHAAAARQRGVALSPPFAVPNIAIGSFGSVTQIKSLLASRTQLWDVAAAGPLAGGAAAALLFGAGLALSVAAQGELPAEGAEAVRAAALAAGLVPVPAQLLQSSLLLGGLGSSVLHASPGGLWVHPLLIAGWCGLTSTALNCLPVGSLDGGRLALAAWGRKGLRALSIASYAGLALGLVGGALSLSWGLFVLIVQRTPECAPLDAITGVDKQRERASVAIASLALLVLLPLSLSLPQ